jgi:hypothetical protein
LASNGNNNGWQTQKERILMWAGLTLIGYEVLVPELLGEHFHFEVLLTGSGALRRSDHAVGRQALERGRCGRHQENRDREGDSDRDREGEDRPAGSSECDDRIKKWAWENGYTLIFLSVCFLITWVVILVSSNV